MKRILLGAIATATLATGLTPALADPPSWAPAHGRRDHDRNDAQRGQYWRDARRYDYNRADPRYGAYDAARYYRDGSNYRERRLGRNDRVYRGYDGQYYCRRTDGTTGLILGGVLGGVIGNSLDGGRSSTLGTLLGVAGGAALGSSIDRGNVRCR